MPLQATSGAASYDGFGGGVVAEPNYIESCFSTYLYTGNGSTQTITNGIDLAGKGGLVWWKNRTNATGHGLIDTTRGIDYYLSSNTTDAQDGPVSYISSVSSTGYSIGAGTQFVNQSANNYASWTFRKQPKFFDVVTYTGDGAAPRNIPHNLGSTPGCILIKCTNTTGDWFVWHRSMTSTTSNYLVLNSTAAQASGFYWPNGVTDTYFSVNGGLGNINTNGNTYVAYLFAHNAGGFGLTGTDNVISCGTFTTDGSGNATVNLGYEPQWVMIKASSSTSNWAIGDNMRGMPASSSATSATAAGARLFPNEAGAETDSNQSAPNATATGFSFSYTAKPNVTFIYIAIRRGPMKVPTSGTSVYTGVTRTGTGATANITNIGFPTDLVMSRDRQSADADFFQFFDRLRGPLLNIKSTGTLAETSAADSLTSFASMNGFSVGADTGQNGINRNTSNYVYECFRRAPSTFDEVCYTGTGTTTTQTHNLQAVPELIIVKRRSGAAYWYVYSATYGRNYYAFLNDTMGFQSDPGNSWGTTDPTSTTFSLSPLTEANASGSTYVAYLWATNPGVTKVGSYTGNGSSQTINCGFTSGARFVLIKRTDSTGDWYVWDSARGIVSGNDPHLSLNASNAEVTTDDTIDTDSTGFVVNQVAATNVNVSSATYIYLAIA